LERMYFSNLSSQEKVSLLVAGDKKFCKVGKISFSGEEVGGGERET